MCLRSPKNLKFGHFTLLFGSGRQRNVQKHITHVQSDCFCSLNLLFCGVVVALVVAKGYVHTGPVPNGSDPILERTISVHTVPFRLSTSVHMGPVCYGSVLNRSKKSSCFYQLSMRSTITSTSAQA